MIPSDVRPNDALGGVPGAHLGLSWSPVQGDLLDELEALSRRCEDVDGVPVRLPRSLIERTYLPAAREHVAMVGRDSRGELRACASVRMVRGPGRNDVALRGAIDPAWRGRGIGRAVLGWQDRWGMAFLAGQEERPATIGVPISAHLVDRRRLYTAAGFSCHARIELHSRALTPASAGEAAPRPSGWVTRPILAADAAAIAALGALDTSDPLGFLAGALAVEELARTCDPAVSRMALHGATLGGAILAHTSRDLTGEPVGWVHTLLLEPHDDVVASYLLTSTFDAMGAAGLHRAMIRTTPATAARWRRSLQDTGCEPAGVDLLYSIELP